MATIPLKDITFPGLDNTYTIPEIDNTLSTAGKAADAKKTGDKLDDLSGSTRNLFDYHKLQATGITISNGVVSGAASAFNTAFNNGIPIEITFDPNTQYTWSFKAKNNGDVTTGNGLSFRFKYTDNTVDANSVPNSTSSFTQFSFTSASEKTVSALLINYGSAGSNVWELEEIQLEKGTSRSAYVPSITAADSVARAIANENSTSIAKAVLQGASDVLKPSTLGGIDSVFVIPNNRMYGLLNITESDIANLPAYGTYGSIVKLSPLNRGAWTIVIYTVFTATYERVFIGSMFDDSVVWDEIGAKQARKSFSIISDSYSTFSGWMPDSQPSYYPDNSTTVTDVSKTYWYKISQELKYKLLINDSWSGSTICTDTRSGDINESFVKRIENSMGEKRATDEKPDIILILGGTNDSSLNRTVGSVLYNNWTATDLQKVLPAFCYMCNYIKKWNPQATIINIVNTGLNQDIISGMATATEHYGITNIVLSNIDKANGHPTASGMTQIYDQIKAALI